MRGGGRHILHTKQAYTCWVCKLVACGAVCRDRIVGCHACPEAGRPQYARRRERLSSQPGPHITPAIATDMPSPPGLPPPLATPEELAALPGQSFTAPVGPDTAALLEQISSLPAIPTRIVVPEPELERFAAIARVLMERHVSLESAAGSIPLWRPRMLRGTPRSCFGHCPL